MSIPHKAFLAMLAEKQQILRDNHLIDTIEMMRTDIQEKVDSKKLGIDEPLKGKGYPYNEQDEKPEVDETYNKLTPSQGRDADRKLKPTRATVAKVGLPSTDKERASYVKKHADEKGGKPGNTKARKLRDLMLKGKRNNEDVDQVDELKSSTLRSYADKAMKDNQNRVIRQIANDPAPTPKKSMDKLRSRSASVQAALSRLDARSKRRDGDKTKLTKSLARENVGLDEATIHTVFVTTSRTAYRKLEALIASIDGYKESEFDNGKKMASFVFDANNHGGAARRKVGEFIKKISGATFSHAIAEDAELEEGPARQNPLKTNFGGMKGAKNT
jgi:hypothetical protein